jgi:hypothetical protein
VPVDDSHVRSFLVQTRNFLLGEEHDDRFRERNDVVAGQDAEVLAELHPFFTPETNNHEFLLPADQAVVRYREWLARWEAQGWRIDTQQISRDAPRRAYAIPSPGRREQPRGWVLDAVPLMPPMKFAGQRVAADAESA